MGMHHLFFMFAMALRPCSPHITPLTRLLASANIENENKRRRRAFAIRLRQPGFIQLAFQFSTLESGC